ncbi:MAG TPA: GtrA family protein [Pseudonocardia sp.]|nr:GtrA family protein [Pseudonocardia sp.]
MSASLPLPAPRKIARPTWPRGASQPISLRDPGLPVRPHPGGPGAGGRVSGLARLLVGTGQLGAAPRRRLNARLVGQLVRFAAIGIISTAVQLGLFLLLRNEVGVLTANLISLVLSTVANTEANRRITFRIRGRAGAGRHQLQALVVFGLSLALSSGALGLLGLVAPAAGRGAELVVLMAANVLATVARFALLRSWVFGARRSA